MARNKEQVILTHPYLSHKQLSNSSVREDWILHQEVILKRKPVWEKHKLTCRFNLSLLENGSVLELQLSLTFTIFFPIGT